MPACAGPAGHRGPAADGAGTVKDTGVSQFAKYDVQIATFLTGYSVLVTTVYFA
jgi:hypothetical protein